MNDKFLSTVLGAVAAYFLIDQIKKMRGDIAPTPASGVPAVVDDGDSVIV